MLTWKDMTAFFAAVAMIVLSTSLAAGIFSGIAVWVALDSYHHRHYTPSAHRRYLMRQSRRRMKS